MSWSSKADWRAPRFTLLMLAAATVLAGCERERPRVGCFLYSLDRSTRYVAIDVTLSGGTDFGSYRGNIDWGDGRTQTIELPRDSRFIVPHTYEQYRAYSIAITVRTTFRGTHIEVGCSVSVPLNECSFSEEFRDDFSMGADERWTKQVIATNGGGIRETHETRGSGGNPDGFRRMTHEFTLTTSPEFVDIFVHHIYGFGTVGGEVRGPIELIRYGEDRIKLAPGTATSAVGSGAVILQNGRYHVAPLTGGQFSNTTWERIDVILTETDFTPRPDFSRNGPPMRFGYLRSNSNRFPLLIEHGIDNWRVEVCH